VGVEDALAKISSTVTGGTLLQLIGSSRPQFRSDFPKGVNIIITPQQDRTYVQSGHSRQWTGNGMERTLITNTHPQMNHVGHDFWYAGSGSCNAGLDPTKAEQRGVGTVCKMYYDSSQMLTSKGESTLPFIVLAHELIHSYHCLNGIKKPNDEEEWTTGIGQFRWEPFTENQIRLEAGLPMRESY
jgi:hypothetical protein